MASFKALCLAGVASLVATVAANAADLLPPPPPVEQPFYAPAPAVIGGGWYLRGDVGVGIVDYKQKGSTFAPGYSVPGISYDQDTLEDSAFVDLGVGYRFNEYFRADITGEYRARANYSGVESYQTSGCPGGCTIPRGYDSYNSSVQSTVGLINGYVDLGTWYSVTPFIGAGVGLARVNVGATTDTGVISQAFGAAAGSPGGVGSSAGYSQTNVAFALMAGLDFAVTQNLKMEVGYRYLDMGNVSTGTINCIASTGCPQEVQHHRLSSNDIRIGFRYMLADLVPIGPAPQLPLIRKY